MTIEEHEQIALVNWAKLNERRYPGIELIYHISNEGKRSVQAGAKEKAMGLRRGIPDIHIPVPSPGGRYHSLYIELKAPAYPSLGNSRGKLSADQKQWLSDLRAAGNAACAAWGWEAAAKAITDYFAGDAVPAEYKETKK